MNILDGDNEWRQVSRVMCDKKMSIKLKYKIYKTIVKTAMIYWSECWAVTKNDTKKLHITGMRMVRWARGKTKKDNTKNEDIWMEANIEPIMNDTLPPKETTEMVWPSVREGMGGYHQEDIKHANAQKEKKGNQRKDGYIISSEPHYFYSSLVSKYANLTS